MNIEALLQTTSTALGINVNQVDAANVAEVLKIRGMHKRHWNAAIDKTAYEMQPPRRLRASVQKVLDIYEDLCDKHVKVDCPFCIQSGFVDIVIIEGKHQGREKTFIFDHTDQGKHKHVAFCKKKALEGSPFIPRQMYVPCTCENGDLKNIRMKEYDWLKPSARQWAVDRRFHGDDAEFRQENCIQYLLHVARREEHLFKPLTLDITPEQEQYIQGLRRAV